MRCCRVNGYRTFFESQVTTLVISYPRTHGLWLQRNRDVMTWDSKKHLKSNNATSWFCYRHVLYVTAGFMLSWGPRKPQWSPIRIQNHKMVHNGIDEPQKLNVGSKCVVMQMPGVVLATACTWMSALRLYLIVQGAICRGRNRYGKYDIDIEVFAYRIFF